MASPAVLGSRALRASSRHAAARSIQQRGMAAAASGSFQYETGDASGVKFASRDLPGPTTSLTVVAKAGTRYQPLPGYADALEKFAFKVGPVRTCGRRVVWLKNGIVHLKTIGSTNHARSRTPRRRNISLPFPREPRPSSQIPPR
jgi:hypothetical protein